jgi:cell division septum initiation protein DivIVA
MSSTEPDRNRFVALPFTVVRKGYDRDEVRNYFDRFDAELRVTATDRDAAAAQARNLAAQLEDARDEIDELRKEVDRLSVPPTTAEGMSDRISRMLRLASDEASEVRAQAQAEAAEMISIAEQQATEMRGKYETLLGETKEKREQLEVEFEQTLANARSEATKISEAAGAEAERLTKEAEAKRNSAQQDFEVTMAERRTKLTRAMEELEASSRSEAAQRIKEATDESNRLVSSATQSADRKIAHAKELAEEMRVLRGRVLAQLLGIRGQLDSVPAMLAAVNRESELLDGAPEPRSLSSKQSGAGRQKAIPDKTGEDEIVDERESAEISS